MALMSPHPPAAPPEYSRRRSIRVVGWNAVFVIAGVLSVAAVAEVWMRVDAAGARSGDSAVMTTRLPLRMVPKVGRLYKPMAEVRYTNNADYWTVSRANSLGFLDREPPSPMEAASACHVTVIGDSFVDAREVPIADKLQVRLEEVAVRDFPDWNLTTSAFGVGGTGQFEQLAYYDEYARFLHPKLVVLVFHAVNDYTDNAPLLRGLARGEDPDVPCAMVGYRRKDGTMTVRPGDPTCGAHLLPNLPNSWLVRAVAKAERTSVLIGRLSRPYPWWRYHQFRTRVAFLAQRPEYAELLKDLDSARFDFGADQLAPLLQNALDYTAFAWQQLKQRTTRDAAALVILTTHASGGRGDPLFERTRNIAEALDIPVISHADYITSRGANVPTAQWSRDAHWNANGHLWAAEALAEYLEAHPQVCGGR